MNEFKHREFFLREMKHRGISQAPRLGAPRFLTTLRFWACMTLLCLFASPSTASAVNRETTSLDSLLTFYYERAASLMGEGELDSAQRYFDKAFATKGVKKSPVYPVLMNEQGTLFFYFGQLEQAWETKKAVLPYLPHMTDLEKHVSVYNDLGILYHRFNQNDSSMYYYHKALDAAERYQDASWLANLHMNVSVFYHNLKRYEKAEEHIDQAVKYVVQTDDRQTILYTWQVRAGIKSVVGKVEESGESMKKAWALACEDGGNADWQLRCIPSLYRYFKASNQPDSVRYYLNIGNELLGQLPTNSITATGFIQVRQEENYENGRYKEALQDLVRLNTKQAGTNKLSLYEKMARCYQHLNQPAKAFVYMDSARMWTDSLGREKVTKNMADFEVKYQTQAKELKIAHLEQKVAMKETALLRGGLALVVLLGIVLFVMFYSRQKRQKVKLEIKQLKHEKEITAARRYIEGMEEECKYFAKELHDGIANDLLGLQFKVMAQKSLASSNQQGDYSGYASRNPSRNGSRSISIDGSKDLPTLINQIRNEVRNISHKLMPPEFDLLTLPQILEHYLQTLQENTGIQTEFHFSEEEKTNLPISNDVGREIYRIIQEITSNIVKHSTAGKIEITLHLNGGGNSRLAIVNDGEPLEMPTAHPAGIGLRTVQDRIKALEGKMDESAHSNQQFILTFTQNPYELPNNNH